MSVKWGAPGLKPNTRHPLAFLMEAADDIAYCVSDIEDAIEKRVVSQDQFFSELPAEVQATFRAGDSHSGTRSIANAAFVDFRISLTRFLVARAAELFVKHYDQIVAGEFRMLLAADPEASEPLNALKKYAREHIFVSREAVNIELGGHRIVIDLLDSMAPLLLLSHSDFQSVLPRAERPPAYGALALERRLATLLPGRHVLTYRHCVDKDPSCEQVYRTQMLVDYVSGMTNPHAVRVHRMLNGSGDFSDV